MKTRARIIATAIAAIVSAVAIDADQRPGVAAPPAKPSAVLRGVVIDIVSRAPVRFAAVSVGLPEGRGFDRTVIADDEGRFEVTMVPDGVYVLSASAPGYLQAVLGQRRLGGPGTPIEIAEGEIRNDIVIPMTRGGVISGRVVDDLGDPVPGLLVLALRGAFGDSPPVPSNIGLSRTDDRGAFRLFMIQPGQYYVYAQQNSSSTFGFSETAAPVSTYYPNATDVGGARRLTVVPGRETSGVDIVLVSARLARLRGRAVMSTGVPFVGATITLYSRVRGMRSIPEGATVKADGTFEILGVAPGQYVLTVRPRGMRAGEDVETGRVEISVVGDNIDNVAIVGTRGSTVHGTIVTDSGDPLPLAPQLLAVRPTPAPEERGGEMPRAAVRHDYTFELKNLLGRHRLEVEIAGLPPQWGVKRIRWQGEDVTHTPFDFRGQALDDVEIVMSDVWATLSGVVRNTAGAPVDDAPLVLFPLDEGLRIPGSRYIRGFRTDRLGRFGLSWLLPGEYLLASPPDMEAEQWNDPAFLKSMVDGAARVTLVDDEEREIELRVRTQQ